MGSRDDIVKEILWGIGSPESVEELCRAVVDIIDDKLRPDFLALFVTDKERRKSHLICGKNIKNANVPPMPVGSLPWEWMKREGMIEKIPAPTTLSIPLSFIEGLEGFLYLGFKREIDPELEGALEIIGFHIAGIISKIKTMDELKRLRRFEKKYFLETLERINLAVENAPIGIFIMEGDSLVFVNSSVERITGYPLSLLKDMDFPCDLVNKEDLEVVKNLIHGKKPFECRSMVRLNTRDGKEKLVRMWLKGVLQSGEEYTIGVMENITALKRAKERIKGLEDRLNIIVENIPDAVFELDEMGNILYANTSTRDILGYSPDEIRGKNLFKEIEKYRDSETARMLREWMVAGGGRDSFVVRMMGKDGSEKYLEMRFIPVIDEDNKKGYAVFGRDLTGELQTRYVLQDTHRELGELLRFQELVLEMAPVGIIILDGEFRCSRVNRRALEILWVEPEEILGKNLLIHLPEDIKEKMVSFFETLKREDIGSIEVEIVNKKGERKFLNIRGKMIIQVSDSPNIILMVRDITEEKMLQENLINIQKMESISTFTAGIAHDINNTLTAIISAAGLLYQYVSEEGVQYIEAIEKAVSASSDMIKDLLSFTKQRVGHPEVFDLNSLIEDTGTMIRRIVPEDVKFVTKLSKEPLYIFADRTQIEEVILNLVSNAVDAMPRGGDLIIESSLAEGRVELKVVDTGIGMDKEVRKKVFEPFFTTKEKGTGLGLAVVYGLVHENKGEIYLESEKGKGTTFILRFPFYTGEVPQIKKEEKKEMPYGKEAILLVEDEEVVRKTIFDFMKKLGYNIRSVGSRKEAIDILREISSEIDMVISDVVLPDGSAMDIYNFIKENLDREIPFLFISGYTNDVLLKKGISSGEFHFLQKPFQPLQLAEKVREILGGIDREIT